MLKNVILVFICLFFFYISTSCSREKEYTLAKIGDQTISASEFNKEFDNVRLEYLSFNVQDKKVLNDLKASFLERLIEEKILLNAATKLKINVTQEELDKEVALIQKDYPEKSFFETLMSEYIDYDEWKRRIETKLLIEKLVNRVTVSQVSIEKGEVERYYEEHSEEFFLPEQVRARQIVVGSEATAHEILKRLEAGEDFIELAKEESLGPESEKGGELGYFSRGHMPQEFDAVVFSLLAGDVSSVVKSPYGFHIFRVEDKREARRISIDEVYDEIKEKMRQERAEKEYSKWLKKIKSETKIEINHQLLEKSMK